MNKRKWKEIGIYALAVLVGKVEFVGCFPMIPAFFTVAYMEEINRTLLLIFSIFGMALFIPVQAMAKYTMAILVTAVVIKLIEWADKTCRTWVGAISMAASMFLITIAGEVLQIRNRAVVWMGGARILIDCRYCIACITDNPLFFRRKYFVEKKQRSENGNHHAGTWGKVAILCEII